MPRVSPYRLATHLSFAFVTYGLLSWTAMDLLSNRASVNTAASNISMIAKGPDGLAVLRRLQMLNRGAVAVCSIAGITIFVRLTFHPSICVNYFGCEHIRRHPLKRISHHSPTFLPTHVVRAERSLLVTSQDYLMATGP